ncbi:MAG: multidrug efflux protein [Verrucomicrobia bacterium RIFCSPHIGHO2_12_FULL_41_10]|nr:MAG: multidrug efflux protein [Verrucomicrobia bacterium RIFCSPHIGHO2_12_FULL_41_10]HLB33506.1 efflux RND transporter permease subunit [Chthoniobacterales bacterium]
MKLTDLFIKRPVLAIVINLMILLAGYEAIHLLNIREYPHSDIAVLKIVTGYIGANADLVRGYITAPIEKAVATAEGIDYIESSSAQGISTITAHLKLNQDPNSVLTKIQTELARVRGELPPEADSPTISLQNADDRAAMYLSFSCDRMDSNQITDFLERVIQPKLTAIQGIQRADVLGAKVFAMRIWLKPDRLAALGVSASDVSHALKANNYNAAIGKTKGSMTSLNLIANTNLTTPEEFKQLVVKEKEGALVHLKEVADVELGAEDYDSDVRFDGKHASFIGIWCLPSANTLDVVQHIRTELPTLRKLLPPGMTLEVPYDSTLYIQDAIKEVIHTLLETLAIVIVVIFLFLGTLRSVLIPVIAIPISLIGAAIIMLLAGFTINLLTLLAIVLAVGLVVDDAIVVVENVERHLYHGLSPLHAAMKGARELVAPIIAMTITLAAVYTPIGIQGGLTGALFREFAFTLAGAVLISGIVALTLSPMMSSKLLRRDDEKKGIPGWINHRFTDLQLFYERFLRSILRYRIAILVVAAFWVALLPLFYFYSSKELAPHEDQGIVYGIVQAAPNSTLDQTLLYTNLINKTLFSFPEIEHSFQITNPNGGFSGMVIKPWSQRKRTSQELAAELGKKTEDIPGLRVIAVTPPALPGGSTFPVHFVISSTAEPRQLLEFANKLVKAALQSGLFIFADDDLKYDQPQVEIIFDRNKVSSLGLDLQQVGSDLSTLFSGSYVNRFSIQGRSYKVIPQIKREDRLDPDQLKKIYITGPNKQLIQLSTFATLKQTTEPRELKRFQQLNSVTITGILAPGITVEAGLKTLEKKAAEILPHDYVIDYGGESRQFHTEGNTLATTLCFSFLLIFLVLAAQFESFRDPFIVLFGSVPLALSGALLFTFLGFTSINIYSQVGLITLVGLVSKNGILIVQFANHLQLEGLSQWEAIISSAKTRLRPVLMTSIATVAGHFPLILATGPGAGARHSIGIILVTGMIIGTGFTLFVLPAIYLFVSKKKALVEKHYLHGGILEHAIVLE